MTPPTPPKNQPPVAAGQAAKNKDAASARRRKIAPTTPSNVLQEDMPPPPPSAAAKKPEKSVKKKKRIRSSFSMPESHFALLAELKTRSSSFGINAKKSELLAAGLQLLKNLPDTSLKAAILPCLRSDEKPVKTYERKK